MTSDDLEREADAAAMRGDHVRARDLLRLVVQRSPALFEPWLKLSAMCRATGDPGGALGAVDGALAVRPLDFSALLMRATLLDALGDVQTAGEAFGRALAQQPDPVPPPLAPVLERARARYAGWQDAQAARLHACVPHPSPAIARMIEAAVRRAAPDRAGPTHYCYPGLPEIEFYDRACFPWLAELEAATDVIAAEFEAVAAARSAHLVPYVRYPESVPLDQWRALNHNRDWTAIHLVEQGRIVDANARHCPRTMALLARLPQPHIPGAGPNAMFSLLAPQTHIPSHTGIANTRLVCHLPLIVPPECWFRVGSETREWRRGEAWVFDDTIEHEAMNPSKALRVILIADCWHPQLSAIERDNVAAVIAAGGQVHGL